MCRWVPDELRPSPSDTSTEPRRRLEDLGADDILQTTPLSFRKTTVLMVLGSESLTPLCIIWIGMASPGQRSDYRGSTAGEFWHALCAALHLLLQEVIRRTCSVLVCFIMQHDPSTADSKANAFKKKLKPSLV